ncbi:Rrf2 family transcriptional regulator [Peribacillus alkalitolerans]|uniref:Rrf2 family transcriptional regulator n=1 Tax=Peribacillus alkalitolerans TaxID=1550385 RepID=UPI0013D57533|nr:Rrf2 family transcriptional regulator [Peribacillus alkalitolerans]
MRLTSYSDYSVRVLIYLSIHHEKLNNIKDIAHVYDISKNHLMKIIYNLGKLGYIETIRGRNGGIRLAKEPNEINLGALLRQTEEDFHIVECFSKDHNHCAISPVCNLKGVFYQAKQAFLQVLDSYTLEDVVTNRIVLKEYLQNPKTVPEIIEP